MNDETRIDPQHTGARRFLRIVGPVVLIAGVVFAAIGFISFFSAFGGEDFPRFFWCAFLGLPMIFLGLVLTKLGYMGRIARYVAGEAAPVVKDTFNYMADGTQEGIKTVGRAVAEGLGSGLREGLRGAPLIGGAEKTVERVRCHKCNRLNTADARFCDQCGAALAKPVPCPGCGELNDPDARFCDNCGVSLDES